MPRPDPTARLRSAGCVFAEEEAALLLAHTADDAELERLVRAREAGAPLEQLLGWAEFDTLRIRLEPGVFVPRQRSLLLVEEAARLAPPGATVLDLCCGSGALLAAVLRRRPDVVPLAADLDPAAVTAARRNLPPDAVHEGDLFAALPDAARGRVDVVLLNAPYVPTERIADLPPEARDHEHRLALDGGADGLAVHRRVLAEAGAWLAPGAIVLTEVATHQLATIADLAVHRGWRATPIVDEERRATVVRMER